jgi:O-antigen ligase
MITINQKLIILILLTLPFSLVSGPFLSDLSVVLISIFFLIILIYKKKLNYIYKNTFFLFFILWCFYLFLNSLLSNYVALSLESSLFYFRFGIFSLALIYIFETDKLLENKLGLSVIIAFTIIIIDALFSFFYGHNLIGLEYQNNRLSGFFGDEWILGSYLIRLMPLILLINIANYSYKFSFGFIIFLLFFDITIALSGERTAFFLNILTNLLLILLIPKFKKLLILKNLISIILLFLVFISFPQKKERLFDYTIEQINLFGNTKYIFSEQHHRHYVAAFKMFKDKPFFGHGPKSFRVACNEENYSYLNGCSTHPHNTYMQLLSETGLIGAMPVIMLFIFINYIFARQLIFYFLKKKYFYKSNFIITLICIYITLFPFTSTGNFFHNWLSVIYFLPIGICLFYFKNNNYVYKHE